MTKNKSTNYLIFFLYFFVCANVNYAFSKSKQFKKPNFIIIQADDLGWDDLPLSGNSFVSIPNINELAKSSLNINRFYTNSVCAATRASLLTGKDFLITGVSHVHGGKDYININEQTFANIFKKEGYSTGIWGKWHSGNSQGYYPWQRGFDEAYMAKLYQHNHSSGSFNGTPVQTNRWADEVIVDYAIDFIERNKETPFLAYLSFLTVHEPLVAREKIVQKYQSHGLSKNLSTLYAMIEQMDTEIGRLLLHLNKLSLQNNTYVLFMSDNGPAIIHKWLTDKDREIRYVNKYKGHKGNLWENGVKSPFLISIPTMIASKKVTSEKITSKKLTSKKMNLLSDVTDIFPTIAELASIDLSKYNLELTGKSFAQNILNNNHLRPQKVVFNYANIGWPPTSNAWSPKGVKNEYLPLSNNSDVLIIKNQIVSIIRGDYKLLKNPSKKENNILNSDHYVLINIVNDPLETNNIASIKPKIYAEMKLILENKYRQIISSENTFQPITFFITPNSNNAIKLYAPKFVSKGISVGYNFSYPWNKRHSYATYQLSVSQAVEVFPVISKTGNTTGLQYLLEINGSKSKSIKQVNNSLFFEKLTIPSGKYTLKLSVSNTEQQNIPNQEISFKTLELRNSAE